ncbi:MAG: EutN/CcmL family microcompartment protein [Planctomycetes bacterium]|nr:EutN/CcmL family microcompartment protein [Planctomycetota bacterium]
MMLGTVRGTVFATRKHGRFEGEKLLVIQEETPGGAPVGPTFLALDRVDSGIGDRVVVNKEGSSARLIYGLDDIPVQAVVVAVVDHIETIPDDPNRGSTR